MKTRTRSRLVYVCFTLACLGLVFSVIAWQQGWLSKRDVKELAQIARNQGFGSVVHAIKLKLSGAAEMITTDYTYGRHPVPGRGHSPWVLRGNLDGRPRILSFALAPQIWAAYDTQTASLYQVWRGELLFQGAAYDYRHGPQPESSGVWYLRNEQPVQWYLQSAASDATVPADVQYLGHVYGPGQQTAGFRFALKSGDLRLEITEYPELESQSYGLALLRQFSQDAPLTELTASFSIAGAEPIPAKGTVKYPLQDPTTIINTVSERRLIAVDDELEVGRLVIADSHCLSCHNPQHEVVGPPWSRIASRYRGDVRKAILREKPINSLVNSIRDGSQGKWGQRSMPPHRSMSAADARAAAVYILSQPSADDTSLAPLKPDGTPYAASRSYETNSPPSTVHPAFTLENILPEGFEPKVGGMDFRSDGKLLVASWDPDGTVFLIDPAALPQNRVTRIAEGLHEPLGLKVVDKRLYVLQKQELTELVDSDGDEIIDEYRSFSSAWPVSTNFHSFAFGLLHRDDSLYVLLSICALPGGASCPEQLPTQGKLLRIRLADGEVETVASGFRTPNGIGLGPDNAIFVTDNEGDWLPANKLVRVQEGGFYGSRSVPDPGVMEAIALPPVVWLPQHEIGNSPSQPLLLVEGPYAGQMIHGDVSNGGVKRVYMEEVGGVLQGAVFQFSGGFQAGVNRMVRGPDGSIYLGEIGNPPNWSVEGMAWHGLEKLTYNGASVFEILRVNVETDGFTLTLTEPLAADLEPQNTDLLVKQWFYHPTEQYGGPKYDQRELNVSALELSGDRRQLRAYIDGLETGHVIYLRLDKRMRSVTGRPLWTAEAWYTLNKARSGYDSQPPPATE